MEILYVMRLIVTLALFIGINCSSVLKRNGTAGVDLDAQTLIALGTELNNSLITVIGKVIENYHNCTWSPWTDCGARRPNYFSTKTRTKHCVVDKLGTGRHAETEIVVCEGGTETTEKVCPVTYNMTANGFCMRLHTTGKTRDEAEIVCTNEAGFLINIDSDEKYADVQTIMIANDIKSQIQIDGRRKNSTSEWGYAYGSTSGYFHWFRGHPIANSKYLCLLLSGYRSSPNDRFRTLNYLCEQSQPFVCEVPA